MIQTQADKTSKYLKNNLASLLQNKLLICGKDGWRNL